MLVPYREPAGSKSAAIKALAEGHSVEYAALVSHVPVAKVAALAAKAAKIPHS